MRADRPNIGTNGNLDPPDRFVRLPRIPCLPHTRKQPSKMDKEINVLALVKGEEKFIFLFDDANRDQTLRQLARFAANPELDFSWYDAAMLSRKIRDAVPVEDDMLIDSELDNLSVEDFS